MLKKAIKILLLFLILGAGAIELSAQREKRPTLPTPENPVVDTIPRESSSRIDTMDRMTSDQLMANEPSQGDGPYKMTKNPWTAVALTVFPGVGQIYNADYWKAPIFLGAAGALAFVIADNHIKYKDQEAIANQYDKKSIDYRIAANIRDNYRSNRDVAGLYLLGVYIVAAIDAYVGAHLYDFNVDDDLSLRPAVTPEGGIGIAMTYRLN